MNREQIIQMAREAGFETLPTTKEREFICDIADLERLVAAIRLATKEEDAKICEEELVDEKSTGSSEDVAYNYAILHAAKAIRASK